jgi:UDP-2,3-diacylglucosamine pyrophosphatase LpxH
MVSASGCESDPMAAPHNHIFVSDFHLGEGRDPETGQVPPAEDFFHDRSFARFLAYHVDIQRQALADQDPIRSRPWNLVIVGDLFEFMEISALPDEGPEMTRVRGFPKHTGLSARERRFGLGTRVQECVWKLERIYLGHPLLFQALAWFLAHPGYRLTILKGNHDVELSWPGVQSRFRELIHQAYAVWGQSTAGSCPDDLPLPVHAELPPGLDLVDLAERVRFPPSFCYEKDLFYAEHGGQFDHTTRFPNFEDPTLPERPDLIQLPPGSLFVRYVYNDVEQIHPFAENLKPVSRYLLWLVGTTPAGTGRILCYLVRGTFLRGLKNLRDRWRRMQGLEPEAVVTPEQMGCSNPPMSEFFCHGLVKIQDEVRRQLKREASKVGLLAALGLLLRLAGLILLMLGFRFFTTGGYGWCALSLLFVPVTWGLAGFLLDRADDVLMSPFLSEAAARIDALLAEDPDGPGRVPYYLFGHNHRSEVRRISPGGDGGSGPRWYVNTGSWLPEFHQHQKYDPFRGLFRLTFFCLLPGMTGVGGTPPVLQEWRPDANAPQPVC